MEEFPTEINQLKSPQYFFTFMELAKKFYDDHKLMSHALDESKLEEEINACKEWWIDKRNFDEDDASDIAWDSLKPLFKKLIDHNGDIFEN